MPGAIDAFFQSDQAGQLLEINDTGVGRTTTYRYDAAGNRLVRDPRRGSARGAGGFVTRGRKPIERGMQRGHEATEVALVRESLTDEVADVRVGADRNEKDIHQSDLR